MKKFYQKTVSVVIIALLLGILSACATPVVPTEPPITTPTPAPTMTSTPTSEPTATDTPVPIATNTPAPTATDTPAPTPTDTPTPTPTDTPTPEPTATDTPVPTATNTPTPKPTATNTPKPTKTPTPTNTPTPTPGVVDTIQWDYTYKGQTTTYTLYKAQLSCDGRIIDIFSSSSNYHPDTSSILAVGSTYMAECGYITEAALKNDSWLISGFSIRNCRTIYSDGREDPDERFFVMNDDKYYYLQSGAPYIAGDHYVIPFKQYKQVYITPTPTPANPTPTIIPYDDNNSITVDGIKYIVTEINQNIIDYLCSHSTEENYIFMKRLGYNHFAYNFNSNEMIYRGIFHYSRRELADENGVGYRMKTSDGVDKPLWRVFESISEEYRNEYNEIVYPVGNATYEVYSADYKKYNAKKERYQSIDAYTYYIYRDESGNVTNYSYGHWGFSN